MTQLEPAGDPFDLARFVAAQEGVYERALVELGDGRKRTHWMWFIFPQLRGLGGSETARRFGISGVDEARAYLAHAVLGPRLVAAGEAVLRTGERSAREVLGAPDDLKLCSCATLFASVSEGPDSVHGRLLERFFDGQRDPETLRLLAEVG
ncbi:MAG: calpastatin [Planctomycetes bacterium]|jgi:uncharacterized protein (DUF1810 family)|nr:calpastatin [Planctomycetota bacterium]MDP6409867.1 DUF1810 domain-containing protein [Planctomycetota bacterium]